MMRTQIYLPRSLYRTVQLLAKQENRPTAEVVRELLKRSLADRLTRSSVGEALTTLANIRGTGPRDLSTNIDKYLYEE